MLDGVLATLGFALAADVYGNGIDKGEVRFAGGETGARGTQCSDSEHETP